MGRFNHIPKHEAIAGLLSVGIGVTLLAVKFVAYFLTGSAAIFSDALESIVNVLASGFAFYSLFLAHMPPDKEHPYGHGKVEFLSAAFEGGMILLASFAILYKGIDGLVRGGLRTEALDSGLYLMGFAMLVNGGLGVYLVAVGRKRGSITLEADGHHLLSDAVTSVAVIVALLVVRLTGWTWADPLTAVLVAGYIAWIASGLLRRSTHGLMDKQDEADNKILAEILDAHRGPEGREPRICSYHKLRHRHTGRYHWIDFHLVLPGNMDIRKSHEVASALEHEIEVAFGVEASDATAHVEPCGEAGCAHCGRGEAAAVPGAGGSAAGSGVGFSG